MYRQCHFYFQMKCSLSKLFWKASFADTNCSGVSQALNTLNESAVNILKSKECFNKTDLGKTVADLVLNRLTPYDLRAEDIGSLEVCKSHLVSMP